MIFIGGAPTTKVGEATYYIAIYPTPMICNDKVPNSNEFFWYWALGIVWFGVVTGNNYLITKCMYQWTTEFFHFKYFRLISLLISLKF